MQRAKGARIERSVVNWHKERGFHAERVPLSGAMAYRRNGSDVDAYVLGRETAPIVYEVKARKRIALWSMMGTADGLVLIGDRQPPLFCLTEAAYERLVNAAKRAP